MEHLQLQTTEMPFCRLCFTQGVELYEIFPGAGNDNESLLIKIMDCVTVAITFDDDYNSYICAKCVTTVEEFYDYKEKCKENDALLREKRKTVDQTAIYNVVNMPSEEEVANSNGSNGTTQDPLGSMDDQQMTLEHRISIEGGAPLNGNIIEFKKQLFTASPEQLGIWICVASGSDIQCPAMIQVDENVQVVAEIGQHNHGLPVSVTDNPPQDTKPPMLTPPLQQQPQQQPQQPQPSQQQTVVVPQPKASVAPGTSTTSGSASKKRKAKDQPSKRKISNDILVGDGWLVDVETQKRHHYQLVTKDGYQTFLIFNGYRFRTQQKIRNGIASWKCAWNGRKGCQAILHITEDYQKVKEVGNPHNHEPSLRDRMISGKPSNGNDGVLMASDGEESLHAGAELQQITIAATVASHAGSSNNNSINAQTVATTTLGSAVTATVTGGASSSITSNAVANLNAVTTTVSHSSSLDHLSTSEIVDFVQQSSSGSDQLVTTVVDADVHNAAVVGVVDDDVGKDDMPMDIEEIIRPHVVLHATND
ncbi:uncharacterized protein LOC129717560 [Wyeomyia smithii]|uniref:uncharacterized protein LOC129717560 n=1 Tax=Wyeomyia smithii TaxID=174621 RepID=UPI002467DB3C|nr:uncharacterized protein LOC129717560 [Wyeomyia smithii]